MRNLLDFKNALKGLFKTTEITISANSSNTTQATASATVSAQRTRLDFSSYLPSLNALSTRLNSMVGFVF